MMKKKTALTSIVIVVILIISIAIGFAAQMLFDAIDRTRYPRPESEYVVEGGKTMSIRQMVEEYTEAYGVPEYLVYAVIRTESSFDVNAMSRRGAIGLMQMTPDTFTWMQSKTKESLSDEAIYSPNVNIKYGTYYLSYLYYQFGDWNLVLAAYNAGPGNVTSWLEDSRYSDGAGHLTNIPFEETRNYIQKVNDAVEVYKRLYYNN